MTLGKEVVETYVSMLDKQEFGSAYAFLRKKVLEVYNKLKLINIKTSDKIIKKAYEIRKYNIKDMDSLHIAYAESFNIDYFITTDKLLINASNRAGLKMKVMNPIEFIMEVI